MYDTLLYDARPMALLLPERVFATAALYGYPANLCAADALDLGCGTGRALEATGDQIGGRLVGADVSARACELARQRVARHGARATIHTADLLTLMPDQLGRFDYIFSIGVIYSLPAEVRAHACALIGACLKPGGVVALTYYAGSRPQLRAQLFALLRQQDDPAAPIPERVAVARQNLVGYRGRVRAASPFRAGLDEAITYTERLPDTVFFHEVLGSPFEALSTATLASELAPFGLEFLDYAVPTDVGGCPTSRERVVAAGLADFSGGTYRTALFGRPAGSPTPPDVRSAAVRWTTRLAPVPLQGAGDEVHYRSPGDDATVRTSRLRTRVMIDRLISGPAGWSELFAHVQQQASAVHAPAPTEDGLAADLTYLWQNRFVTPALTDAQPPVTSS